MWNSKDVYYISDSTGILVTNLGQSLLCQFPEISFHEEHFPFIRTVEEAKKTLKYILKHSGGRRPLIFSTIMDRNILRIFDSPEVELFDAYESFLTKLENCIETKALRVSGFYRQIDTMAMARRVEAIHYCLEHDDGTNVGGFDTADVILVGVSRAGKTPVSVYLATQLGLKAGNFPLTAEYLSQYRLPEGVLRNKNRAIGLTTFPEVLQKIRDKRFPASTYSKLTTCIDELDQAKEIFLKYKIPMINSAGKSIEEVAVQVTQELGLSKKPHTLNDNSL